VVNLATTLGSGTGSSSEKIHVKADELSEVYKQLNTIVEDLDLHLNLYIKKIKSNTFYTFGEAKKTIDSLGDANEKFLELVDQYNRASTLVSFSLNEMMENDDAIAKRIIGNLQV